MRTRMYGGVRGQGLAAPIYSIGICLRYGNPVRLISDRGIGCAG